MMATKKQKKAPSTAKGFAAMPKSIGKYELTTDEDVADFMQWLRDGGAVIGKVACADDLRGIKDILKSSLYSAWCVCVHTHSHTCTHADDLCGIKGILKSTLYSACIKCIHRPVTLRISGSYRGPSFRYVLYLLSLSIVPVYSVNTGL
jgi:hypothetical protein